MSDELQALLTKQVTDLRAALLVYDVTLSVVGTELPKQLPGWVQSQINAAQDAYRQVTGEEPLSLTNRPTPT